MHPTDNNIPRNIFQEIIEEIVRPDEISLDTIRFHDILNPVLWEDEKLKPEIRKVFLNNVMAFIKYAGLDDVSFSDIILTGSMANYNYTENSDIDIHILLDFKEVSDDIDLVADLLKTKKKLWSKTYQTHIKNHEIELYFQNKDEPHHATGVYSIINNRWLKKPVKKVVDINTKNIKEKVYGFIDMFIELEKLVGTSDFIDMYERIKEKLKKYRKAGLEGVGEFSTENLVFKVLRNLSYIKDFFDLKSDHFSEKMSIK